MGKMASLYWNIPMVRYAFSPGNTSHGNISYQYTRSIGMQSPYNLQYLEHNNGMRVWIEDPNGGVYNHWIHILWLISQKIYEITEKNSQALQYGISSFPNTFNY